MKHVSLKAASGLFPDDYPVKTSKYHLLQEEGLPSDNLPFLTGEESFRTLIRIPGLFPDKIEGLHEEEINSSIMGNKSILRGANHPASFQWQGTFTYESVVWPTKMHALAGVASKIHTFAGTDPLKAEYLGMKALTNKKYWESRRLCVACKILQTSAFQNISVARALLHPQIVDNFPEKTKFLYQSEIPFDMDEFWQMPGNQIGDLCSEVRFVLRKPHRINGLTESAFQVFLLFVYKA